MNSFIIQTKQLKIMGVLRIYIKGMLIGMIAEYMFRIHTGYLEGFILGCLIAEMIVIIISNWND